MDGSGLSLVVDHLGPIEHAQIALRPLTVFVGRNNTGKTYAAQALYAARQALLAARPAYVDNLDSPQRSALDELVRRRRTAGDQERDETGDWIPPILLETIARAISENLERSGRALELRLKASFGVDNLRQISTWKDTGALAVELRRSEAAGSDFALFGSRGTSAPIHSALQQSELPWSEFHGYLPFQTSLFGNGDARSDEREEQRHSLMWFLVSEYWDRVSAWWGLTGTPHYLPAGRSGLLNAWTDVVKLRIQLERDRFGLPSIPEPSLDGVALDFISSLADVLGSRPSGVRHRRWPWGMTVRGEDQSAFVGARKLLSSVMEGRITVEPHRAQVPTLAYEQSGQSIAIRHASSMVADLAPLAIWIDRLLSPNDLLIVDEPESHLHPEAIRMVARVLVRLVNSGVRVVCATHSSVLLHELSNAVLRAAVPELPEEDRASGYSAEDQLSVDNLAVHRFVRPQDEEAVHVEQLKVDPEWGIPEDEYVKVAADLSDDSARLVALLK